ncbi:MAG: hypothetical protein M3Z25_22660, partial [Actinomycetota bacterium]|nr:hypothetical protein [Actinomycetota bacterium]
PPAALPAAAQPPAAPRPTAGPSKVIMVIRHGEKPPTKSGAGIDLNGQPDTHSLTESGWTRAVYLVDLFAPLSGSSPAGLSRPRTIYAAGVSAEGEGTRTRQTVGPLAAELGIPVNDKFGKGNETELVAQAAAQPGPTLICWQHGEIPAIAAALGQVSPAPPKTWPDDRFDVVWTFIATGNGWRFQEVPEMLLPGDRAAGFS